MKRGRIFKRKSRLTGEPLSTYSIRYVVDGRQRTESTHSTSYEDAKVLLTKRLAAGDDGSYIDAERERLTVGEALERVVGFYELQGHRSLETVRSHVRRLSEALGPRRRALEVTTGQVQRVVQGWRAKNEFSPATCNRRLAILRRAYRLAKLRLDPVRLDFVDLFLPEASPRGRYMSPDVFAAIYAHLPTDDLRAFFEFSYLCGIRKQQLARTTVAHVDTGRWVITWPAAEVKAKEPHVLPLDSRPLDLVQELLHRRPLHCRYLFHGPRCAPGATPSARYACIGDSKRAWRSAVAKAGLPVGRSTGGLCWHNTRHSAVTNLVNAGVPAHEAMAVSGHRTRSVFDRYSIRVEEQTRAALRAATTFTRERQTGERRVIPLAERQRHS
jgi:integrase